MEKKAMVFTGPGIEVFRLVSLKSALRIELAGMKVRSGFSALKIAKTVTGLKTNDRSKQIEAIDAKLAMMTGGDQ